MTGWITDSAGLPISTEGVSIPPTLWDSDTTIWDGGETTWDNRSLPQHHANLAKATSRA